MRTVSKGERCRVTVRAAGPHPDNATLAAVATAVGGFTIVEGIGGFDGPRGLEVEPCYAAVLTGSAGGCRVGVQLLAEWALTHGESCTMEEWETVTVWERWES